MKKIVQWSFNEKSSSYKEVVDRARREKIVSMAK